MGRHVLKTFEDLTIGGLYRYQTDVAQCMYTQGSRLGGTFWEFYPEHPKFVTLLYLGSCSRQQAIPHKFLDVRTGRFTYGMKCNDTLDLLTLICDSDV